jgi:hypothetical protein
MLLDILIVTSTGDRDYLAACLGSLRRYPLGRGGFASTSSTTRARTVPRTSLGAGFPEVRLRKVGYYAGFSRANNVGLTETSAPYALVLNPDTRVPAGSLDSLIELMERTSRDLNRRLSPGARGRNARPCGETLVPDTAQRARSLHRDRASLWRDGAPRRLPRSHG